MPWTSKRLSKYLYLREMKRYIRLGWLIVAAILSQSSIGTSQEYLFDYSPRVKEVYRDIIDLRVTSAHAKLQAYSQQEPYNLAYLHMESYLNFFQLFISEEYPLYSTYKDKKNKILKGLDQLGDKDPYKRYAIAEVKLQSALIRAKFDEVIGGSREMYAAYKLLKDNQEKYPDFIYNKKSLSIIHSMIETISFPGILKKILGIEGSLDTGLQEIEALIAWSQANPDFIFQEEIDAIYLYILAYLANDQSRVEEYLPQARFQPSQSALSTFMVSKFQQRAGHNEAALSTLRNRPNADDQEAFPYLDLQEGICLLRKGDAIAGHHIEAFLSTFKGRHYIKEAHQKLAWSALLFDNDLVDYKQHMSKVESSGYLVVDADIQAWREAKQSQTPDPLLLRARLLYDGGYYHQAMTLLVREGYRYKGDQQDNLEYQYRLGRIFQALKNYPEAILYCNATMTQDKKGNTYYACNAALQIGLIHEEQGQWSKAKKYFELCLKMKPNTYQRSLHQKAKSGLQRIKAK